MKQFLLITLLCFFAFQGSSIRFEGYPESWDSGLLSNEKNRTELKIYPNPCKSDKLTIQFESKQIKEFRITNIAGKQVLHKKFYYPENRKQIVLSDIQNGIYLIQVKSVDNKTVVKKLIVSKN
jgi:hypothetical protein